MDRPDRYTIIVPNPKYKIPNMDFPDWDSVTVKSRELCEREIKHIIRDNEFGVSIQMCEFCN